MTSISYCQVKRTATKVRDSAGDSWLALFKLHRWHSTVTQDHLQSELLRVTNPKAVTRDEELTEHLERWELSIKRLSAYGTDYDIRNKPHLLINSLELMMRERKMVYEAIERTVSSSTPQENKH